MRAVHFAQHLERAPLLFVGLVLGPQHVVDRLLPARIQRHGLVGFGQKSRRPDLVVAAGFAVVHDHEGREVLVLRAEAVGDPRARAGPAGNVRPAHQLDGRGCVIVPFHIAGMDERHVVHMPRHVGQDVGDPRAALAMLLPAEGRFEQLAAGREKSGLRIAARQHLPAALLQLGLVVEGIHVRRRARHEKPDDGLRARRENRDFGQERIDRGGGARLLVQQRGQRERAEPLPDLLEKFATRWEDESSGCFVVEHGG